MSIVQIPDTLYQQLNHAAGHRNSTVDDLARIAISAYLSSLSDSQEIYGAAKEQKKDARCKLLSRANAARQEYFANRAQNVKIVSLTSTRNID